jgi:hypothetical membrane protein
VRSAATRPAIRQIESVGSPFQHSLPVILGIAIAFSYIFFAVLAGLRFPRPFGPWHENTLSQLGNPVLNPGGSGLYLIGCALAGIFTIAFFVSLRAWRTTGTRGQNLLLTVVQGLGILGGIALFMNAIFPETEYAQHHFWAGMLFNAFAATALLAIPALRRPGFSSSHLIAFNLAAFMAVVLMFVFAPVHWVEWLPAGMFLVFPTVLGVRTRALVKDSRIDARTAASGRSSLRLRH